MSRIILAATISIFAIAATPAAAQYGGSPDQQIDPPAGYAGPITGAQPGKDDAQAPDSGADANADKGDDQAGDAGPATPDKDQIDDQAGPPPPGAEAGYGPGECRRSDGTTGTIVGGGAGALVGRGIDRHGERATGTIIGAVVGALVGRAVEQSSSCR